MKKRNSFAVILLAVFLCILIVMVVQLFPLIKDIVTSHGDEASIATYVDSIGWRGVPALIGLSALQVVIPFIPAPAVGVLTGLSYGVYWGPLIFLSGLALGNLFVMVAVRQLHSFIVPKLKPRTKPKGKTFLSKERLGQIKRPEVVAFFFVMIPWVSSTGPYLFAETKVSLGKYIIAVILGNIPSTIVYVFLGDRISSGNYTTAIVTGAIAVVALLILLPFRKKLMGWVMREA